jgi:serine/threonine-protein kinase
MDLDATDVIRDEEAARAAAFGRAVAILCVVGLLVSAFRDLPLRDRIIINAPLAVLAITGLGVWWRSRKAGTYSRSLFRAFGLISAASALLLIYRLGVFTPIIVIIVLGLAFFINTADRKFAASMALVVIGIYLTLALLTSFGVLADAGVWRTPGLQQKLSMSAIVTAVMLAQLFVTLANRRAMQDAIMSAQRAMRDVQTREAQLAEAQENLDLALRGGNAGRLTGRTLNGYRVGNVIGRGAMGEVYSARNEETGRRVAIKVLQGSDDATMAERFVREAQIARKVQAPNLVELVDTGVAPDGSPFIAMELLEGRDLSAMLRDRTNLPLVEVVALVEACAKGLTALHDAGVIHRDLKPQNLFLPTSTTKEWKILDYGVSKIVGATMTKGELLGTPGYMSPEQAQSKDVDIRSDVFSLGAVAYRALTGRRAFSGEDMPAILYQVVYGTPARPSTLIQGLPPGLEDVLYKALAKKRDERYRTPIELAIAFREAAEHPVRTSSTNESRWRPSSPTLTVDVPKV